MTDIQDQSAVDLFAAVTELAPMLGPDVELAPLDDSETPIPHAIRLLAAFLPGANELVAEASALRDELETVKNQLAAQKGLVTKANNALAAAKGEIDDLAEVVEANLPAAPRDFSDAAGDYHGSAQDLLELIGMAEEIGLVFIGPDCMEVPGLAPRVLHKTDFARISNDRLALNVASLLVRGPAEGLGYLIGGYVLLADGEMVAIAMRVDGQLCVNPGSQYELKQDVIF